MSSASVGVTERVRRSLGDLSKSERKVARTLLSGPPTIGLESVSQFAARAGVSGPTVSRFVSRLGFDNYAAFQQALLEDLSARVLSPIDVYRSHVAASDHPPLELAATALAEAVTDTLAQLSPPDFERAVSLVADERHRVLVTGGWTSHLLAAMLTSLVRPFRSGVLHVPSLAAERAASLADLARDDVVVLFDFRRYELDTYEFARLARERGGRLVLLTDPWLSPIADLADAVLPAQVDGPSPFESLAPTVALVETLVTEVARRLGVAGTDRLGRYGSIADQWVRPFAKALEPSVAGTHIINEGEA
jgi:DNA-binding MurR/RpiR family transcriptional regulator